MRRSKRDSDFFDVTQPPRRGLVRPTCAIASGVDGTPLPLLPDSGRGGNVVAEAPVPMRIRFHSNWYWRTNPYEVNGGNEGALLGGNDFRVAYWIGRGIRRP